MIKIENGCPECKAHLFIEQDGDQKMYCPKCNTYLDLGLNTEFWCYCITKDGCDFWSRKKEVK